MQTAVQRENGTLTPEMMDALLDQPLLARVATASPADHRPHVVPVWYMWDGESIWISSYSSTRKIRDLRGNPFCSIVIDEAESGWDFRGVIFQGRAKLLVEPREFVSEMTTRIYTRYLGDEGVLDPSPQEWIHDPENMLIKVTPTQTFTWYSRLAD